MSKPHPFAVEAANNIRSQIAAHLSLVEIDKQERQLAAQHDADNAMSMAVHYLREGNVPGAMRKCVQALSALSKLPDSAGAGRRTGGAA